ncbi:MAG: hypothetical protein ACRDRA_15160 [Pseudonocardiaceae bacterium]
MSAPTTVTGPAGLRLLIGEQLRFRLLALAARAAPSSHTPPRTPIGRWSSQAPESAPSGRSAPDLAPAETPAGYRSNPAPPLRVPGGQPVPSPAGAEHAEVAGTDRMGIP